MANQPQQITVEVERRETRGKNSARRMRVKGSIPANVYGLDGGPFAVAVSPKRIEEVLRLGSGRNTIFTLALDGGSQSRAVMLREIQRDPVSERLVHVDFLRVDPTKRIHVMVPVRLIGTPLGVKNDGGVLDFVHREIEVECLPANIPEHFDIDVSALHINQHVSVADLKSEPNVDVLDDPETILAVVSEPRKEEAETPAEGAEPIEGADVEAAPKKEGDSDDSDEK